LTTAGIVIAAYTSVLLAEVAGDRSIYTIASLSARFRPLPVLLGIAPAFALKMLAAVLVAGAVSRLPPSAIAAISVVTWLITAWTVWHRESPGDSGAFARIRHPSVIAFVSIAFTEWGDPGQLTAALLATHFRAPFLVWSAATAALLTKAGVGLILGVTARRYLEAAWLRVAACAFCIVNAVVVGITAMRG
jgi:putative Ca2+/H+ antiporter (TMEM165/GDT1 family)